VSPAGRSAFRHRDFTLFIVGLVTSRFAMTMASVAIGWQVYAVRENPLDLGLVGLAEFLPLLLLAIPSGNFADRLPRRNLFAFAIAVDTLVAAALLVVTIRGADSVVPFFGLALLTGCASAIGAPAWRAITPSLVPQEILVTALAQRSIGLQLSMIVAPAVGGVLFALQAELVYVVAIVLQLVAVVSILAMRTGRVPVAAGAVGMQEVLGGIRLIRRTRILQGTLSLDLFAVLFGGAVALLPIFARDILEVGPTGLGLLRTAPAIGAFAAALLIARFPIRRKAGPVLLCVVAGFGASMVLFGLSREMWLSMVALALAGGFDMVSMLLRSTILPLVTPDELRGRVNAVEMVFISGSNELGAFESGVAAALIGAVPAVVLGGVATIVIAAVWWRLFPSLAEIDRLEDLRPVSVAPG
jgi:MFS family permease